MNTRKSAYSFSLLLILALSLFGAPTHAFSKPLTITGRVSDANGNAPVRADLHIGKYSEDPAKSNDYPCAADGSFSIPVSVPGVYSLRASAVNHQEITIPLDIEESDFRAGTVAIDVKLHPNEYDLNGTEPIRIIGDWSNKSTEATDTFVLTRAANGKPVYTFTTTATADSVAYEIGGITGTHTVNGTQADYYVYDGGGDYRSVIHTHPGQSVTITFEPLLLAPFTQGSYDDLPRISAMGDPFLEKSLALAMRADQMQNAALTFPPQGGPIHMSAAKMNALLDTLQSAMDVARATKDKRMTEFVAALMAKVYHPQIHFGSIRAQQVLRALPPTSQLWAIAQNYAIEIADLTDTATRKAYVAGLAKNPVRSVRAVALSQEMADAYNAKDTAKWKSQYAILRKDYGDVREISYNLVHYNPDAQVQIGRRVPDFELASLDDGHPITNKSLLGKYYMIDFWATWCGPCVGEMPSLHKAYTKFKGRKGFEILSISMDGSKSAVAPFRNRWKMPWLNAFIPGVFEASLAKTFEVASIPRPILVDPQGNIVATEDSLRGEDLENTLTKFLGEAE